MHIKLINPSLLAVAVMPTKHDRQCLRGKEKHELSMNFFGAPSHQQDTAGPPYMEPMNRRDYAAAVPLLKKAMR